MHECRRLRRSHRSAPKLGRGRLDGPTDRRITDGGGVCSRRNTGKDYRKRDEDEDADFWDDPRRRTRALMLKARTANLPALF